MIKILALGDVVSSCGTQYLADGRRLAGFREKIGADLVVVNGENSADGNGILPSSADALFHAGADVITGGNHSWQRREIYRYFEENPALIRPANYPDAAPGQGYYIADVRGFRVLCINLAGVVFMEPVGSAFDCGDRILRDNAGKYDIALIDVHAEATSEKEALGWYFAGRVAAVWGTHTHVATAAARIYNGPRNVRLGYGHTWNGSRGDHPSVPRKNTDQVHGGDGKPCGARCAVCYRRIAEKMRVGGASGVLIGAARGSFG